jgi:hypothetical protein
LSNKALLLLKIIVQRVQCSGANSSSLLRLNEDKLFLQAVNLMALHLPTTSLYLMAKASTRDEDEGAAAYLHLHRSLSRHPHNAKCRAPD